MLEAVQTALAHATRPEMRLLVLGTNDECHMLRGLLSHTNWGVCYATSLESVASILRGYPVIVCGTQLADATWREVVQRAPDANVIVVAPGADTPLWASVLNEGGYDVLPTPPELPEVIQVATQAWRCSRHRVASQARSATA